MKRQIFAAVAALLLVPASAVARDRNNDNLPDRWERAHGLSLKHKQARRDQDADGVRNLAEFRHGLDPRNDDSDDDGAQDGDEAGRVVSFDGNSGVLVIALLDGSSLSGKVDESTEIECGASDDHGDDEDDHGDDEDDHGDDEDQDLDSHEDADDDADGDHDNGDDGDDDRAAVMSDDDKGDDDDDDSDRSCSTDALIAGAKVHEAELEITRGGKVWDEIELV